jgi:hypothetical protein
VRAEGGRIQARVLLERRQLSEQSLGRLTSCVVALGCGDRRNRASDFARQVSAEDGVQLGDGDSVDAGRAAGFERGAGAGQFLCDELFVVPVGQLAWYAAMRSPRLVMSESAPNGHPY